MAALGIAALRSPALRRQSAVTSFVAPTQKTGRDARDASGLPSLLLQRRHFLTTGRRADGRGAIQRSTAVRSLASSAADLAVGAIAFVGKSYAFMLFAVFVFQRKLIFLPSADVADPRAQGGDPDVVILPAASGQEKLAAVFFKPRPGMPVLVFFHGNGDQIGWGPAYLGRFFQQTGLGFYGIEYPGYGLAKPGSPTESSIHAAAETMLQHLTTKLEVPRSHVVLVGQSIGCAVAVEMARRGFGSRLILLSPFTSMLEVACAVYPFLAPALRVAPWMLLDKFDNKLKAKDVGLPALVVHGNEDEIVPFEMGSQLSELIPNCEFLAVKGYGHNDILDNTQVLTAVAEFSLSGKSTTERS